MLVFERAFWNEQYDMFGMLNDAEKRDSMNPDDYARGRGKFYLVWNCQHNSGRPMLIALMSGNAAHAAEVTPTKVLLEQVMGRLSRTFAPQPVPAPVEVIVTRWKKDPFTRGTYSFVAPGTEPGDYDVMARPVGNLHFAGEATCGTHPATVHGAYLSGLRAAAEVVDSLIGPVQVPEVLVCETNGGQDTFFTRSLHPHPQVGRPRKQVGPPRRQPLSRLHDRPLAVVQGRMLGREAGADWQPAGSSHATRSPRRYRKELDLAERGAEAAVPRARGDCTALGERSEGKVRGGCRRVGPPGRGD